MNLSLYWITCTPSHWLQRNERHSCSESSAFQVEQEFVPKWPERTWDSQEVQVFIGASKLLKSFGCYRKSQNMFWPLFGLLVLKLLLKLYHFKNQFQPISVWVLFSLFSIKTSCTLQTPHKACISQDFRGEFTSPQNWHCVGFCFWEKNAWFPWKWGRVGPVPGNYNSAIRRSNLQTASLNKIIAP